MASFKPQPFGEYFLLERVAVGGMAEIFKAKTYGVGGFEKLLAIKRILPHHAQNREFISMLIDEAKIAVALNHVNIVQVYDLGKINDDYFIAMEFVDGKDLRTIMRKAKQMNIPLSLENTVYIILEICKGLDYAHRKTDRTGKSLGVVHRDISPQNLLITFEGEVKIVDFGIAKAANKVTETEAGVLKGKFSYMSPEQANGYEVDQRADIFSTGIIMYELLAGEKLFTGANHSEILDKIRAYQVDHPLLPAAIPSELEYMLARALEPDLSLRYQYASDFQLELSKYLYSSTLDFTARNLADLMRALFKSEMEEERGKEKVYSVLDEETRSILLKSHAESLVSKTDFSYEQEQRNRARQGQSITRQDADADENSHLTKNRSIIQKFQNILRKGPQPRVALKQVSAAAPRPAVAESEEVTAEARIRPKTVPRPFPKPVLPQSATVSMGSVSVSVPRPAQPAPRPPTKKLVAALVIGSLILGLLVLFARYLDNHLASEPEAADPPVIVGKEPPVEPDRLEPTTATPANLQRTNYDEQKTYENAATTLLESRPTGAQVKTEEGRILGITPLVVFNLPVDKAVALTFSLANHLDSEKSLTLSKNESRRVNILMEPHFGTIEVNSSPSGALVLINQKSIGKTPLRYEKVFPETPTLLTLQRSGYEDYSISFRVKSDEVRIFNKVLEEASRVLLVNSAPTGATVFLNNVNQGTTPREFPDLKPGGEYLLILRATGYRDFLRKFKLEGEKSTKIFAQMQPLNPNFGTLFLDTTPAGATVTLDGRALDQKTPMVLDQLRTDRTYAVRLNLDLHEPVEYRLRVDAEAVTTRSEVLKHLKGRITVKSNPPNARVLLNDRFIGETPIAYYAVDAGLDFTLLLQKEGFRDQIRKMRIDPNQQLSIDFSLEAK